MIISPGWVHPAGAIMNDEGAPGAQNTTNDVIVSGTRRCARAAVVAGLPRLRAAIHTSGPSIEVLRSFLMAAKRLRTIDLLEKYHNELVAEWTRELESVQTRTSPQELRGQAEQFLRLLLDAARSNSLDISSETWTPVRRFLDELSASRARAGYTWVQTATFVFSLKRPIFAILRRELKDDVQAIAQETWLATELVDKLGLHTVSSFQSTREQVIIRQQQELLELSTPVVTLWDGILAIPMIGTLDSARTQVMMEALLQRIVETGSQVAILDITGVPTVDTLVAQHLMKTVTAIRLMGGDCIISGVRAQIAQTIVHLGVDLAGITTKSSLADALALAFQRTGRTVTARAKA
jgi:rsbT co-antagonist protein RsbR